MLRLCQWRRTEGKPDVSGELMMSASDRSDARTDPQSRGSLLNCDSVILEWLLCAWRTSATNGVEKLGERVGHPVWEDLLTWCRADMAFLATEVIFSTSKMLKMTLFHRDHDGRNFSGIGFRLVVDNCSPGKVWLSASLCQQCIGEGIESCAFSCLKNSQHLIQFRRFAMPPCFFLLLCM